MRQMLPGALWILLLAAGCGGGSGDDCTTDADCPSGRYCRSGGCYYDCTFDQDCPEDYHCTPRGRCEPGCVRTNGGVEACDGLDNDCDGQTDEDFPELGGACSNGDCPPGSWVCSADGVGITCDGPQPLPDDSACDGHDGDCDGSTDEDAVERDCPLQQGVCAGAREACLGAAGWSGCDYGPEYTAEVDANCDQLDEDCDGLTDEDVIPILLPEVGTEAVDGIDNNCNGLVDEPGGVMVPVRLKPGVWIDAFEATVFDQRSCTGQRYGIASDDYPAEWPAEGAQGISLYACALPGLIPSGYLSWYRARDACAAQGKRLCSSEEYQTACTDGQIMLMPYGATFVPGVCNDGIGGPGQPVATGSLPDCSADGLTFDMSGNLNEWLDTWDPDGTCPGCAQTVGFGFFCEICDYGAACQPCDLDDPTRIERVYDCGGFGRRDYEIFDRLDTRAYQGVRCCLDGP